MSIYTDAVYIEEYIGLAFMESSVSTVSHSFTLFLQVSKLYDSGP